MNLVTMPTRRSRMKDEYIYMWEDIKKKKRILT
jgi:hypothetical protein